MKVANLKIDHVLRIPHLDLRFDAPVTIICGGNGAGKSSIAESIRLALTGEFDRVELKKDLAEMVQDESIRAPVMAAGNRFQRWNGACLNVAASPPVTRRAAWALRLLRG